MLKLDNYSVFTSGAYSTTAPTAFSLLVLTEQPHSTRLFLKKSRISLLCPVQSRSENALARRHKDEIVVLGETLVKQVFALFQKRSRNHLFRVEIVELRD